MQTTVLTRPCARSDKRQSTDADGVLQCVSKEMGFGPQSPRPTLTSGWRWYRRGV